MPCWFCAEFPTWPCPLCGEFLDAQGRRPEPVAPPSSSSPPSVVAFPLAFSADEPPQAPELLPKPTAVVWEAAGPPPPGGGTTLENFVVNPDPGEESQDRTGPLPHDFRPRFPLFQTTDELGQWCHRCGRWIERRDMAGPCPGPPPPGPEKAREREWWEDMG